MRPRTLPMHKQYIYHPSWANQILAWASPATPVPVALATVALACASSPVPDVSSSHTNARERSNRHCSSHARLLSARAPWRHVRAGTLTRSKPLHVNIHMYNTHTRTIHYTSCTYKVRPRQPHSHRRTHPGGLLHRACQWFSSYCMPASQCPSSSGIRTLSPHWSGGGPQGINMYTFSAT